MNKSKYSLLPLGSGILALIAMVTSKIVEISQGAKVNEIAFTASFFVMVTLFIIRFYSLDVENFKSTIISSDVLQSNLNPMRYVNWMTIAMVIGFFATVVINQEDGFILGMLIYLLMQFALIFAFSGIHSLRSSKYLSRDNLRATVLFSILFWIFTISFVYTLFVYNGSESLIVVPYVVALGIMAHYTWYGLVFKDRSVGFRWLPVIASGIFVFSDSLIGSNVFGVSKAADWVYSLIDLTYLFNIYLFSMALFFLKNKNGNSIFKSN